MLLKVYNYNQQTQHFQTENKPDEQSIFKTLNLGKMKNAVRYLYMKKKPAFVYAMIIFIWIFMIYNININILQTS